MEEKYNVVLAGIQAQVDAAKVIDNLAALFRCPAEQVKRLLVAPRHVVKRDVTAVEAEKYRRALERAGAVCAIESVAFVPEPMDFDVQADGTIALSPGDTAVTAKPMPKSEAASAPQEAVLFEGEINNLISFWKLRNGHGRITRKRCEFAWDNETFSATPAELAKLEEQKHGLASKLVLTHTNGTRIALMAPNMRGFRAALYAFAGQPFDDTALVAPDIAHVKNRTAWLAAVMPLLIAFLIGLWYGPQMMYFSSYSLFKLWIFKLAVIYTAMRCDWVYLQHQGFNPFALGMTPPEQFWSYLFSRAKAFNHGKGYAITWCVLFGIETFGMLLAFF